MGYTSERKQAKYQSFEKNMRFLYGDGRPLTISELKCDIVDLGFAGSHGSLFETKMEVVVWQTRSPGQGYGNTGLYMIRSVLEVGLRRFQKTIVE